MIARVAALLVLLSAVGCLATIDDSRADKTDKPAASEPVTATGDAAPGVGLTSTELPDPVQTTGPTVHEDTPSPDAGDAGTNAPDATPPVDAGAVAAPASLQSHVIGYWPFDYTSGTYVYDFSPYHRLGQTTDMAWKPAVKGDGYDCGGGKSFEVASLAGSSFPSSGTIMFYAIPRGNSTLAGLFEDPSDTARAHFSIVAPTAAQTTATLLRMGTSAGTPKPTAYPYQTVIVNWTPTSTTLYSSTLPAVTLSGGTTDAQRFLFCKGFDGIIDEVVLFDAVFSRNELTGCGC